jgi:hypothetical protein
MSSDIVTLLLCHVASASRRVEPPVLYVEAIPPKCSDSIEVATGTWTSTGARPVLVARKEDTYTFTDAPGRISLYATLNTLPSESTLGSYV